MISQHLQQKNRSWNGMLTYQSRRLSSSTHNLIYGKKIIKKKVRYELSEEKNAMQRKAPKE